MVENNRWGIIYCPKQGVRKSQKRWERIRALLAERQVEYDFVQSEQPESVERLATMLAQNGYRTIVVVGGDSALNRALNGIIAQGDDVRKNITLGVVPNGRGNDWANFWGFDAKNDEQTIEWLIAGRTRKVDVGCVKATARATADDGKETTETMTRYFLNCLNVGLVANIMRIKYKARRIVGLSSLTYLVSMLQLLFQRLEKRMQLKVNEERIDQKVMTVCVGSARGYGQTPSAVPYNGMLDVSVVAYPEVSQLIEGMWMLLTGRFLNHSKVRAFRSSRPISIVDTQHATISVDGIVLSKVDAPLEIRLNKEWINFIIPS